MNEPILSTGEPKRVGWFIMFGENSDNVTIEFMNNTNKEENIMVKMKFHWEKGEKKGSFKVTDFSVDDCIKTAKEEIEKDGAEMVDWYVV